MDIFLDNTYYRMNWYQDIFWGKKDSLGQEKMEIHGS